MASGIRKLNGSGSKHTARWGHRADVKAETKSLRRAEDRTVTAEYAHGPDALIPPSTQCKHGKGDCETCGTTDRRDVIHSARAPNKRELRRARRKAGQ